MAYTTRLGAGLKKIIMKNKLKIIVTIYELVAFFFLFVYSAQDQKEMFQEGKDHSDTNDSKLLKTEALGIF